MARFLTISTQVVVKIAAIRNLGPGPMFARRRTRIRAGGSCVCAPSRWKIPSSLQRAARLHAGQGWGILPLTFLLPYSPSVRAPKCSRRIQVNEKGNRPALTSLNETRFLSCKPGKCGWARAGSRGAKRRHANAWRPGRPWQSQNQGDDDLSVKRMRLTLIGCSVGLMPRG